MKKPHQYIVYCAKQSAPKNKLQAKVAAYLSELDRTLIEGHQFNDFKNKILLDIKDMNTCFRACKSLDPYWFPRKNSDFILSGIHFNKLQLFAVNKTLK
jgi:hypothetical protein